MLDQLYTQYGRAMIEAEIASNRVNELKRRIAEELNKPKSITKPVIEKKSEAKEKKEE